MSKKIKLFISIITVLLMCVPMYVNGASLTLNSQATLTAYDTVAGFSTVIGVSNATPKNQASILIKSPDGTIETRDIFTDANGAATITVPELRSVGSYSVQLVGQPVYSSFMVFAGDPDASHSKITANQSSVRANGSDVMQVEVRLTDAFLNPISSHTVKLISSRSEDMVTDLNAKTDFGGVARFAVSSQKSGSASLTATDETSGVVVTSRLQVAFSGTGFSNTLVTKDIGGDPQTILLAAGSDPAKFKIDNLPASVNVNDPVTFTVTAVDPQGSVVPSYRGTIKFTSTDPNAKLPSPYTFKNSDQGTMTFNVALSFATEGSQTLTVQDQTNNLITAQKSVQVTALHGVVNGQVRITKPATGTYSLNTLEVAGESLPNSSVKIYDNGQQIGQVQASSSGRFSYTTSLLTDGKHTFYAESDGVQSTPVTVTIDSTPASVQQVDITKPELAPGDSTGISIRTDPNVNKVQVEVNGVVTDMEEDPQNPGLYRANITAPMQDGDFSINSVITDAVGNVTPTIEVGKLHVDATLKATGQVSFTVPSAVTGLHAGAGNGKVTLSWTAAQAQSGIAFYRIYYGTDPQNISIVVNTTDSKTSFEISNLQNGTPYYFQVVGVDTLGNEGDNPSEVVSAVPSASAGVPVLCSPNPCATSGPPSAIPKDGPDIYAMIAASIVSAGSVSYMRRRKKV